MTISLQDKTAIVTGAASGIGAAICRAYLDCGADAVVAVDRDPLPDDFADHPRIAAIRGDVALEETHVRAAGAAMDRTGRIDILVNNAGISIVKALHEHTVEEWDTLMGINIRALFLAARHVLPVMIAQKDGVVLNTGSISGEVGIPTQGAYGPSKGALHQMTRQMAVEYGSHGIRVNAVGCGTIDTPIVHSSAAASGDPDAYWNMLRANHPIGRVAAAEEVAGFFAYLASDHARFFTGAILMMDGGYTAR